MHNSIIVHHLMDAVQILFGCKPVAAHAARRMPPWAEAQGLQRTFFRRSTSMTERVHEPHNEQNKAGRLMDLVAPRLAPSDPVATAEGHLLAHGSGLVPRPMPPDPVATLAEAWRAVPPDERLRFLAGASTDEECLALASALVAYVQQKTPHA